MEPSHATADRDGRGTNDESPVRIGAQAAPTATGTVRHQRSMRLLHRAHGIKDSGIGRERGLAGIRNYLQIKNVAVRL